MSEPSLRDTHEPLTCDYCQGFVARHARYPDACPNAMSEPSLRSTIARALVSRHSYRVMTRRESLELADAALAVTRDHAHLLLDNMPVVGGPAAESGYERAVDDMLAALGDGDV